MGNLFEVNDTYSSQLERLKEPSDWYDVIGDFGLGEAEVLELEDSWPLWQEALKNEVSAIKYLFTGSYHPSQNAGGDPAVGYIDSATVSAISDIFQSTERGEFEAILAKTGFSPEHDIWLYSELKSFFYGVKSRNSAILILLT
ncbi:hypothetical protein [Microbulbifer zhoushanensis]|uniref:hypothetical protein n=1 Tax=Microbulbifer zhoushanensis TaxID=2904254 RepID=UPI001F26A336|nr:hypothetical protein [Microbulbifer zhoushanensis]